MRNRLFSRFPKQLTVLIVWPLTAFVHSADAASTPKYIQGNYAVPQTPEVAVTVPYTAAQAAGNFNVVIVGWNGTAHISSLKDTKGNVYQLAVGPIVTGTVGQAIYYAKNISAAAAATNAVTVTFAAAATYPDIRISEYAGIDPANPVDTVVGGIGNSATSSSGTVVTKNPTDLLVSANTVQTLTTSAGSGFTSRLLTSPDGDISEDRVVTTAGSYSASAPLSPPGEWVMELVAFRAAASATPTPTPTPAPVTTAYIQGNYAAPQTAQTTITVPYTAAQKAGDLNVVIIGWNNSTSHIIAFGDSKKNTYHLAVGPTVLSGTPGFTQVMVYANNISAASAGTNAVSLTFDAPATYAEVRILEYSGIGLNSPFDVAVASTGNGASSSSGFVTTTNARDLLVGANTVWTGTNGPGSGFTKRLLTVPDGDITEDRIVTAAGSYNAGAPLTSPGPWIMQMAAFRVASTTSTPAPTPSPTPKASPTPAPSSTPKPSATPSPTPASVGSISLAWSANATTNNPATDARGYRVHWGIVSGSYTHVMDVGNKTTAAVPGLVSGTTYYFAVTAYNSAGVDGLRSNQLSSKAP